MLVLMFLDLSKISSICSTMAVSTASVERNISEMDLIQTMLWNSMSEGTLSRLMRIGIEASEMLTDDLDANLEVWNRNRRHWE